MKVVRPEWKCREFSVADLDAFRVQVRVVVCLNGETRRSGRSGDQFNDRPQADQRFAVPVHGDETEHAVLDAVPLSGPRRVGQTVTVRPVSFASRANSTFQDRTR